MPIFRGTRENAPPPERLVRVQVSKQLILLVVEDATAKASFELPSRHSVSRPHVRCQAAFERIWHIQGSQDQIPALAFG